MTKCLFVVALLVTLSVGAAAQTPDTLVSIAVAGAQHPTQRGSFIPRLAPYFEGGPSVSVYLPSGQDVRTADGLTIIGFSLMGWAEGDATRVRLLALVPRSGAPDVDLRYRSEFLERRDFASYRIAAGETIRMEMRGLGLEPMVLMSRSFQEMFAEAAKLRDALAQLKRP